MNVSGDDLKNRYHTKIIIDHSAYDSLSQYVDKIVDACENILEALDPKVQNTFYYNEMLRNERNTQILRLTYKSLYHCSAMVDLIESFDFTVFCSVKRHTGNAIDTEDESYENPSVWGITMILIYRLTTQSF